MGTSIDPQGLLMDLYRSALAAAAPGPALAASLDAVCGPPSAEPIWVVAVGKASHAMASAALAHLARYQRGPEGGVVIAPSSIPPLHPAMSTLVGDHPVPGPGSVAAGRALASLAARVGPAHEVWVLLSGGATSLAADPVSGVTPEELGTLYSVLLGSGLDIAAMNTVRKRFSRWGAGRLAVALHPARVRSFIVSDVIGDDLSAIGSGPCVPDGATAADVRALLVDAGLWERIPSSMRDHLAEVERDAALETPKPGNPAFTRVEHHVVAGNRLALEAAAARAAALGLSPRVLSAPIQGEAAPAGRALAATLLAGAGRPGQPSTSRARSPCSSAEAKPS